MKINVILNSVSLEKLNKYLFKSVIQIKVFVFLFPSCLEMNVLKQNE